MKLFKHSFFFYLLCVLYIFLGALPMLIVSGLVKKMSWQIANALNIYKNRHWAWTFSLYEGIISISWITVQLVMTQYFWIQPVIIIIGLLIIICNVIPEMMKQFESKGINVS
jgi:hypothetical protein